MNEQDPAVSVAHWRCDPTFEAIARTTTSVGSFASRHGMGLPGGEQLTLAVSEVLAHATAAQTALRGVESAAVDAAVDGAWLTVVVRAGGPRDDDGSVAFATATALADRVEWTVQERADIVVLMEFATRDAGRGTLGSARPVRRAALRGRRPGGAGVAGACGHGARRRR